MTSTGIFFTINDACEFAIRRWGPDARCWNYEGRLDKVGNDPEKTCQIGTERGVIGEHIVKGSGRTWLDAARNAGLFQ